MAQSAALSAAQAGEKMVTVPSSKISAYVETYVIEKSEFGTFDFEQEHEHWDVDPALPRFRSKCDVPLELPFIFTSRSGAKMLCDKEIGRGGYSRCYRLRAIKGRHYALKAIPRAGLTSDAARSRLQREIEIQSQLRHPGIVTFFESQYTPTHWFLVLEHCPNGTLNDMLKKYKRVSEKSASKILLRLFDAVKYLHDRLIFHGDIKLSNILLDEKMRPKLCDFGFAKQLRSTYDRRHHPYGTPSYMAREIVVSPQSFGLEADIWSLGVIMYTLLHGSTPFDGRCTEEIYHRIVHGDLKFPVLDPPVSPAAKAMIVRMLDARPERRPRAVDLAADAWSKQHTEAMSTKVGIILAQKRIKSIIVKSFRLSKKSVETGCRAQVKVDKKEGDRASITDAN